jgi:hypothetical protein
MRRITLIVRFALLVLVACIAGPAFGQTFLPAVHYPVGSVPVAIATADLNGDGLDDLVTAHATTVSVRLAGIYGVLQAATSYVVTNGSLSAIALADLNGDARPEIIVTDKTSDCVAVMRGLGNGTFGPAACKTTGQGPAAVVASDFNGDGHRDVAVINRESNTVSVLLNFGNFAGGSSAGSLRDHVEYPAGSQPTAMALGDITTDGLLDLVVGDAAGFVHVLAANADGTFRSPISMNANVGSVSAIVTGYFFRDGFLDVAVSDSVRTQIRIFQGYGDGRFSLSQTFWPLNDPVSLIADDVTGDGLADLGWVGRTDDMLRVQRAKADLTGFEWPVEFSVGGDPVAVVVGDFDGDQVPDLATANGNSVSVLLDTVLPIASGVTLLASPGQSVVGQAVTLSAAVNAAGATGTITFYDGATSLGVVALANLHASLSVSNLSVAIHSIRADYSGDLTHVPTSSAILNYMVTLESRGATMLSLSSAPNPSFINTPTTLTATVTPADATGWVSFYRDGFWFNAVPVSAGQASVAISTLSVGPHQLTASYSGDPWYLPSSAPALAHTITTNIALESWPRVSLAGAPVTLTARFSPPVSGGTFNVIDFTTTTPPGLSSPAGGDASWLVTSAFEVGDHSLRANYSGPGITLSHSRVILHRVTTEASSVALLTSTASSMLGEPVTLTARITPAIATGKVTFRDGSTVLGTSVIVGSEATLVTSMLPPGARSLRAAINGDADVPPAVSPAVVHTVQATATDTLRQQPGSAANRPRSVAVGDLNRDGVSDLVIADYGTDDTAIGTVRILLGVGDATFQPAISYTSGGVHPIAVALADFNRDGMTDLAVGNNFTDLHRIGNVSVRFGNGDGTFGAETVHPMPLRVQSLAVLDATNDGLVDLVVLLKDGIASGAMSLGARPDGGFSLPLTFLSSPGGAEYRSMTVADFNGDGRDDAAVADFTAKLVRFAGSFTGSFATTFSPHALAAGDFNGDGKADLAVTNGDPGSVGRIFLGNGNGSFAAGASFSMGQSARHIISTDVNADGRTDLVVANAGTHDVSVITGNGNGTFASPVRYLTGTGAIYVAAGEFNGDGRVDFAVANDTANTVSLLLGASNTTTTITNAVELATPSAVGAPFTVRWSVTSAGPGTPTGTVTVTLFPDSCTAPMSAGQCDIVPTVAQFSQAVAVYSGDGSFGSSTSPAVVHQVKTKPTVTITNAAALAAPTPVGQPFSVQWEVSAGTFGTVTVSMDGVAVCAGQIPPTVQQCEVVPLTTGLKTIVVNFPGSFQAFPAASAAVPHLVTSAPFATSTSLEVSSSSSRLGQLVTLTANVSPEAASGKVTFYDGTTVLGVSAMTAGQATLTTPLLPVGTRRLRAHYQGDGVATPSGSASIAHDVTAAFATGFGPPLVTTTFHGMQALVRGDVNGDGLADVVTSHLSDSSIEAWRGTGAGTWVAAGESFSGGAPGAGGQYAGVWASALADFDEDGRPDVAMVTALGNDTVIVALGTGTGAFGSHRTVATGSTPRDVDAGDFNGDGHVDLAVAYFDGLAVGVLLGHGDGTFQPQALLTTSHQPAAVTVADLNADGNADLVVAHQRPLQDSQVGVHLGAGDGTFAAAQYSAVGVTPWAPVVADFNGDGNADVAVVNQDHHSFDQAGQGVSVLLGNGNGTLQPQVLYSTGAGLRPVALAVADVDGDGRMDLAVANEGLAFGPGGGRGLALLSGVGDGTFQPVTQVLETNLSPVDLVVGDFTGDGRTDVVLLSDEGLIVVAGITRTFSVTVVTEPPGLDVIVDGVSYRSSETFSWEAGTTHTIGTALLQPETEETQFRFASWSDGGAATHTFTASGDTTYMASFITEHRLSTSASPASAGTVTATPPSGDGFYPSGTVVSLLASANTAHVFTLWSGDASGAANPAAVTMSGPRTATAVFKATQTILFGPLDDKTFGDPAFPLTASASSELAVAFSIRSGPATIADGRLTITGAGIVVVTASQSGNDHYAAAQEVDASFTAARATPVIIWHAPAEISYGTALGEDQLNASTGVAGTFVYTPGSGVLHAGDHTLGVTFTPVDLNNYNEVTTSVELVVRPAEQQITFGELADKVYGDAPFTIGATSSSKLPVDFTVASGPATMAGNVVTITGAGEVTIRASQSGDDDYQAADDVDRSFMVAKAGVLLTWNDPAAIVYGTPLGAAQLNAALSTPPALAGSFTYAPPAATILNATNGMRHTLTVTFTPVDANNYDLATATVTIEVGKADQEIDFPPLADKTVVDPRFFVFASASSGLGVGVQMLPVHPGPEATADCGTPVIVGAAPLGSDAAMSLTPFCAGTVTLRASQPGDDNYNVAPAVERSFTVARLAQTLSVGALTDNVYGGDPIPLEAEASSELPVEFSIVSGPATIENDMLTITGAGTVEVLVSQFGSRIYDMVEALRSFTVAKAQVSVIGASHERGYWDPAPVLTGAVTGVIGADGITASFSAEASSTTPAGVYPIAITLIDPLNRLADNYSVTLRPGTLTIANPQPAITRLGQSSATIGGAEILLDVEGRDFVRDTVARWNGEALDTTFVSRELVRARVPASRLGAAGVAYITAFQGAPGGGTSNLTEFFVTNTGAPVSAADTATDDNGTATVGGDGPGSAGSVSATMTGSGAVTVAQYEANPGPPAVFRSSDAYFDVFVTPDSTLTSLTVLSCALNGGNRVFWSDGQSWSAVRPQYRETVNGADCVRMVFDTTSSPRIDQLTGTYFAVAMDEIAPSTTAGATTASGAYTFGTWTNEAVIVNLVAADDAQGVGLASLTYSATGPAPVAATVDTDGVASLQIAADGETIVHYAAQDLADNVEAQQTRLVRVDRTAPAATAAATPSEIWPPNGKLVPVTIAGRLSDATAGIGSASYRVDDEYGLVQLSGAVTVRADASYVFTVMLPADRRGGDNDGRTFTVRVTAADRAGNQASAATVVLVAHDQRKQK